MAVVADEGRGACVSTPSNPGLPAGMRDGLKNQLPIIGGSCGCHTQRNSPKSAPGRTRNRLNFSNLRCNRVFGHYGLDRGNSLGMSRLTLIEVV